MTNEETQRGRGWVDCLADCFHIWSVVSLCWTQSRSTSSERANGVILICMFCCCSEYVPKMQINVIPRTLYYTPRIFWLIRERRRGREREIPHHSIYTIPALLWSLGFGYEFTFHHDHLWRKIIIMAMKERWVPRPNRSVDLLYSSPALLWRNGSRCGYALRLRNIFTFHSFISSTASSSSSLLRK